jgi:hypothetical protein
MINPQKTISMKEIQQLSEKLSESWFPASEAVPEMQGAGVPSIPVFVQAEEFGFPPQFAIARYWKSSLPNQPDKWYYEHSFHGNIHPQEIAFAVTHWMPMPAPKGVEQ